MRPILVILAVAAFAAPAGARNVCREQLHLSGNALKNCSIAHYVPRPSGCKWATSYGNGDGLLGQPTSDGGKLDRTTATAAHLTKPLGSRVTLTHGQRSVTVTITDRGPFHSVAEYDLSPAAGRALGFEGNSGYVCDNDRREAIAR